MVIVGRVGVGPVINRSLDLLLHLALELLIAPRVIRQLGNVDSVLVAAGEPKVLLLTQCGRGSGRSTGGSRITCAACDGGFSV